MMATIAPVTKVVAHMDVDAPASDFKPDADPDTMELVFLNHADPKANTVSDDGEAIFLYEASREVQDTLFTRALEIRARRRLAAR